MAGSSAPGPQKTAATSRKRGADVAAADTAAADHSGKQPHVVVRQTDMPKKDWRFLTEGVAIIHQKVFGDAVTESEAKICEFVVLVKRLLERRFKPQWSVIYGPSVAYAAKTRTKCVMSINHTHALVMYKSPQEEIISVADREAASGWTPPTERPRREVKFLLRPEPETSQYTEQTPRIEKFLDESCVHFSQEDDVLDKAQHIRRQLAVRFGGLWHVFVGKDYVAECASGSRNVFLVQVCGLKLFCFQHEQRSKPRSPLLHLLQALPYLLVPLFFFLLMGFNAVCKEEPRIVLTDVAPPQLAQKIDEWLCVWGPENGVMVAGVTIFFSIMGKQVLSKV